MQDDAHQMISIYPVENFLSTNSIKLSTLSHNPSDVTREATPVTVHQAITDGSEYDSINLCISRSGQSFSLAPYTPGILDFENFTCI